MRVGPGISLNADHVFLHADGMGLFANATWNARSRDKRTRSRGMIELPILRHSDPVKRKYLALDKAVLPDDSGEETHLQISLALVSAYVSRTILWAVAVSCLIFADHLLEQNKP